MIQGSTSNYPCDAEAKRQPQVDSQVQRIETNAEVLGKQVEELAQRLIPVSRAVPPTTAEKIGSGGPPTESLCPMADALRRSNDRLSRLVDRLVEVRGLLEI